MDRRSIIKQASVPVCSLRLLPQPFPPRPPVRWRLRSSAQVADTVLQRQKCLQKRYASWSGGKFEVSVHAARIDAGLRVVTRCRARSRDGADRPRTTTHRQEPIFAFGCVKCQVGLTARQMDASDNHGNGRKLMDAFYANYNIKSRSVGNTGTQMGGWYRKEISRPTLLAQRSVWVACSAKPCKSWVWCRKTCLQVTCTRPPKRAQLTPLSPHLHDDEKLASQQGGTVPITTPAGGKVAPSWSSYQRQGFTPRCPPAEFQAIVDAAATTVAACERLPGVRDAFNPIALKRLVAANAA